MYDPNLAFQLDSPTCSEIRDFFPKNKAKIQGCTVFTVFFSGHGCIHNGNFYLCPKDYTSDFPSSNGFSISDLIRYARDLKFEVLNIVIDACQSGHSGTELREAIEKPTKENDSPLCISITASCLPDQSSTTGNPLSPFTKSLNDLIIGAADSHVLRPILTLGDLSRLIPEIPHQSGRRQNVVHYSLNVLGPAHFCLNPLLNDRVRQPHSAILSPQSNLGAAAFKSKADLENIYDSVTHSFQHKALVHALRPICDSSSSDLPALNELLWHYDDWFAAKAKPTNDWSLPLRISASFSTASILVGWESESFIKQRVLAIAKSLETDLRILRNVSSADNLDPLGLLSSHGINSFYFAPIRLSHCYARVGLCLIAAHLGLLDPTEVADLATKLITTIQRDAPNLHVILNESQGPHIGIFFAACGVTQNIAMAEYPFGMYLCDHDIVKGKVLRDENSTELALKYMRQRGSNPATIEYSGIAVPNTTLPILMACAKKLGFEDLIDPYLNCWHKLNTSIFIPEKGSSFGNRVMESGTNVTRTVGSDFYTVVEYCNEVDSEHLDGFERTPILSARGLIKCAAAYIYPNRFPWIF